jgi:S-adenosylmethionine/arginine decarboxylase-like enzyme
MKSKIFIPEPRRFRTTSNTNKLLKALIDAVNGCGATYCTHADYHFDPHGYSAAIILAESHATLHYYPEDKCTDVTIGISNPKDIDIEKFFKIFQEEAQE